jgi:hypothetical protein
MKIKGLIYSLQLTSCRKVTGLIEKDKIFGLNTLERVLLRVHLSICDDCTQYIKHSHIIDQILMSQHSTGQATFRNQQFVLPEGVKLKIFRNIGKSS